MCERRSPGQTATFTDGGTRAASGRACSSVAGELRRPRRSPPPRATQPEQGRLQQNAHSDALVTATSRKSCSYTSPERETQGEGRRSRHALPLYITGRLQERREPRLSLTYIAASFVGRKHTTHQARIRWAKISVKKCSSARNTCAESSLHAHTRSHAHAQHNKQRGRPGTYLHASCAFREHCTRTRRITGGRRKEARPLFSPTWIGRKTHRWRQDHVRQKSNTIRSNGTLTHRPCGNRPHRRLHHSAPSQHMLPCV